MITSAKMNASGASTDGARHPVRPRRVGHLAAERAQASGAPAYISTLTPR